MSSARPRLLVVAGPNGAGKTTITERGLAHEWFHGCEYVNPDLVAQELGDWNDPELVLRAAHIAAERREACLQEARNLAFETCSRHPTSRRLSDARSQRATSCGCSSSEPPPPKSTLRVSRGVCSRAAMKCRSVRSWAAGRARSRTRPRSPPRWIGSTCTTIPWTTGTLSSSRALRMAESRERTRSCQRGRNPLRNGSLLKPSHESAQALVAMRYSRQK